MICGSEWGSVGFMVSVFLLGARLRVGECRVYGFAFFGGGWGRGS